MGRETLAPALLSLVLSSYRGTYRQKDIPEDETETRAKDCGIGPWQCRDPQHKIRAWATDLRPYHGLVP